MRTEVGNFRTDVHTEMGDVRTEVGNFRTDVHTEIGEVRTEIGDLRTDVHTEIGDLRKEVGETHILCEDLQSKVQLLAEGHAVLIHKIDRHHEEARAGRREDRLYQEALMKAMVFRLSQRDDELEERIERLETA